ncbi:hypothetical protein Ancab_026298 [Ancistrocladus abbreviatus]
MFCYLTYAANGLWKEATRIRVILMKEQRGKKQSGCSWTEIGNGVLSSVGADASHPDIDRICEELRRISWHPDEEVLRIHERRLQSCSSMVNHARFAFFFEAHVVLTRIGSLPQHRCRLKLYMFTRYQIGHHGGDFVQLHPIPFTEMLMLCRTHVDHGKLWSLTKFGNQARYNSMPCSGRSIIYMPCQHFHTFWK